LWNINGQNVTGMSNGAPQAGKEIGHNLDIGDIWDVLDSGFANGQ
jgi:hypothetical protein